MKLNQPIELRLGANSKYPLNGGLCLDQESNIALSQSPYGGLINMCCDDGGLPIKRWGQAYLYPTSLGSGGINGLYPDYKGYTMIAHGTKLYKQSGNNNPVEIYSSLTNSKVFFFVYNSMLYIKTSNQFLKYDGTTVSEVVPYIPTVSINRKPDGSQSTVNESWNLLGRGFKESFNGDGTTKVYKLSFQNLDTDTVLSTLGGTEGNGFTVDRTAGTVTFTTAPAAGTNNVVITAYKTFSGNREQILNCTRAYEAYGRMFFYGNKDSKNSYWVMGISDSNDCSYFPTKYRYNLTKTDKELTVFVNHFGLLIGLTEDLTFKIEESTFDNQASFPVKYLNTSIGCDMPNTMQLINNNPVWCNSYGGVYLLQSTLIEGEKDIKPLSSNINGTPERPGLLQESKSDLYNASSVDFGNKYYLCVKDKCYVWDYQQSFSIKEPKTLTWYYYTNINAGCFIVRDNILMYGDRDNGLIAKFVNVPNDFGQPILGLWRSKLMDFGYTDYMKIISDIWLTTRANSSSSIAINYYNDQGQLLQTASIPASQLKSFSWNNFSWDRFTWQVQIFSPTLRFRPKIKNVRYFQLELKNNEFNENLSIISLVINYALTKRVR